MLIRELVERTILPKDKITEPDAWLDLTDEAREYFAQMGYSEWDDQIDLPAVENALVDANLEDAGDNTLFSIVDLYVYLKC